jgi:hypothetical protein
MPIPTDKEGREVALYLLVVFAIVILGIRFLGG